MSKQSEAKEAQGYIDKPVPRTCANCKQYKSKIRRIHGVWSSLMEERESELRCGLGGFKVKKTAACNRFEQKVTE